MDLIPTGPVGRTLFAGIAVLVFLVGAWNMLTLTTQTPTIQFYTTVAVGLALLAVAVAVPQRRD